MSDEDLYRQGGQLTSLRNEEALVDHDMGSVPEAKHSLRKSGKTARSNGNSSRRSRVAHMEATLNVTGEVNISDVPEELGPYSGKYNISGNWQRGAKLFVEEFTLNYLMATYTKPQVSLLKGQCDAGASMHGKFRVAIDNTVFAMPDASLEIFRDVGSY